MSTISTHVLDTALGGPASGIPLTLERRDGGRWTLIGGGTTDDDGRVPSLLDRGVEFGPGTYRMTFETSAYLKRRHDGGFYPVVRVEFEVDDAAEHYHVPLLLSPYGYSTYRGS